MKIVLTADRDSTQLFENKDGKRTNKPLKDASGNPRYLTKCIEQGSSDILDSYAHTFYVPTKKKFSKGDSFSLDTERLAIRKKDYTFTDKESNEEITVQLSYLIERSAASDLDEV